MSGRRSKKLKTRNRILCAVAVFMSVFIVYTVVFYSVKGWQWDSLFPYVLGVGGIVDVMTAGVAIADKLTGRKEKTDNEV